MDVVDHFGAQIFDLNGIALVSFENEFHHSLQLGRCDDRGDVKVGSIVNVGAVYAETTTTLYCTQNEAHDFITQLIAYY